MYNVPINARQGQNSPSLTLFETDDGYVRLAFQDGPVQEHGINGTTNEYVIELIIQRLESLNQPPFNCRENSLAITKLEEALMWLQSRTAKRVQRGVEGTNTP